MRSLMRTAIGGSALFRCFALVPSRSARSPRNLFSSIGGSEVQDALHAVTEKIGAGVETRESNEPCQLVVVSKTKPVESLMEAFEGGARRFGENYIQEILEKAPQMPQEVKWHFIGHIQSNKAKKLVQGVPNLAVIETVDSLKLAKKLDAAACEAGKVLDIYLQVDTSGEDSKFGVAPGSTASLAVQISEVCPDLRVAGLMTIGAPGDSSCFDKLVACRADAAAALGKEPASLALSMGMSGDFEIAIAKGATSVRVGSSIFGARAYIGSKAP
mmetsp:Transcript_35520/g.80138  ORF Transcript_35520/g.80138 Transcript_35520/m.80138 type:complete len:272 (+) Transcript_35520:102-917(+)